MDTTINPNSLLVATASLAHLGHSDVSTLIGLSNNLNVRDLDIYKETDLILYLSAHNVTKSGLKIVKVAVHVLQKQEESTRTKYAFISDPDLQRVIIIPCHGVATAGLVLVDCPGVLLVNELLHVADHHGPGDVVTVELSL